MNKYYCIKCRRKLKVNSYSTWNPDLSEEIVKHLYANFTAWTCSNCNLAFVFMNTSGNENTVLTIINLESYLQEIELNPIINLSEIIKDDSHDDIIKIDYDKMKVSVSSKEED